MPPAKKAAKKKAPVKKKEPYEGAVILGAIALLGYLLSRKGGNGGPPGEQVWQDPVVSLS